MIARVVDAAVASDAISTTVVLGFRPEEVMRVLAGSEIKLLENPQFRTGLASSLKLGLASLGVDMDGAMIMLGDMPFITSSQINSLLSQFDPDSPCDIVVPAREGRLGNPVIWPRRYIPALLELEGDRGARQLLAKFSDNVRAVQVEHDSMFLDVDTPEELAKASRRFEEFPG